MSNWVERFQMEVGIIIGLTFGLMFTFIVYCWGSKWRDIVRTHNLCHNLHGQVGAEEFAAGCAAEQRKLFGCAPHADKVERLQQELKILQESPARQRRTQWG